MLQITNYKFIQQIIKIQIKAGTHAPHQVHSQFKAIAYPRSTYNTHSYTVPKIVREYPCTIQQVSIKLADSPVSDPWFKTNALC